MLLGRRGNKKYNIGERKILMTTYQILCLFGVQALATAIVSAIVATFISAGKGARQARLQEEADTKTVRYALQALLRDRLYQLYTHCKDKDGATVNERENFENMYKWYHSLGENGVMDDTRKKFLMLPIKDED